MRSTHSSWPVSASVSSTAEMRTPKASFLTLAGTRITPACERLSPAHSLIDRLEVSYVDRHQHAAFGGGKLEDLRVGEPLEFHLGVQRSYVVTTLNEGPAHRPTGDMDVEQDPHPRPAGP